MYNNIYTSGVKSPWFHACNIIAIVDNCDIYIKLSYTCFTVIEDDWSNLHKERKIPKNTFVGNILSKMLKRILDPLKSLFCSEDIKNSHTTIY